MIAEVPVLICEDDSGLARSLKRKIETAVPDAIVDLATTPAEVVAKLDEVATVRFGSCYWFLIVDIHLKDSRRPGQAVYISEQPFIDRLMKGSNNQVVFFVSAHLQDPKIRAFRERCGGESHARLLFLAKDIQGTWIREILDRMQMIVCSKKIEDGIKATFVVDAPIASHEVAAYVGRDVPGAGDATQVLASLARDISRHWPHLDQETRDLVRRFFKVVEDGERIRISMF